MECGSLLPLYPPRACSRAASLGGIHKSQRGQQAGLKESGSKLPHSKTTERRYHQKPMVTITRASYWLAKLSKLRVDRARGDPAPHKPLLLLVLCDLVEKENLRNAVLPLSPELAYRFCTYWSIVAARRPQRPDVRLPFHHLAADGILVHAGPLLGAEICAASVSAMQRRITDRKEKGDAVS